jgi:hypothetical protein
MGAGRRKETCGGAQGRLRQPRRAPGAFAPRAPPAFSAPPPASPSAAAPRPPSPPSPPAPPPPAAAPGPPPPPAAGPRAAPVPPQRQPAAICQRSCGCPNVAPDLEALRDQWTFFVATREPVPNKLSLEIGARRTLAGVLCQHKVRGRARADTWRALASAAALRWRSSSTRACRHGSLPSAGGGPKTDGLAGTTV